MDDIDLKKKLGLKIRQYRKSLNITQELFAEKINLSQRQVSFIEIGKCFPSPESLVNISRVLNCSIKDLFDFEFIEDLDCMKLELNNMIENYSEDKLKILYIVAKNL